MTTIEPELFGTRAHLGERTRTGGIDWLIVAGFLGALAVATGAFGAHWLEGEIEAGRFRPRDGQTFQTGVEYHIYHALALAAVGLLSRVAPGRASRAIQVSGWCFALGVLLFSGSLYGIVLLGQRWLGMVAPLGGTALIIGWVALAIAAARTRTIGAG